MEVKVSPLIDNSPRVSQPQAERQNDSQEGLSGGREYDVREAPVIKLIRLMGVGKKVNIEV